MININHDSLAAAIRADIFAISNDDFFATLDAHDDANDFADIYIIELRDDLDSAIDIFCPSTATDSDIDTFTTDFLALIARDTKYFYNTALDAIITRCHRR